VQVLRRRWHAGLVASDDLDVLLRWEASGGTWEVAARGPDGVVLALLTCSGDEQVGRLESAEPDVLAHVDHAR
jgi:hypothetical protein